MKKNSIGFCESEHGAIDVNILICTFPPALHPLGQPSVARPTGFPALRFPTSQNRVEPSPERNERTNPLPHRDRPRIRLDQPIKHLQERHVDSRLPTAFDSQIAQSASPSELPDGSLSRPSQDLDSPYGLPVAVYRTAAPPPGYQHRYGQ